jgi:lipopolysaccharide transport system permease protein
VSRIAAARHAVTLSWQLFRRTLGAKFRKSYLGYFWLVAPALLVAGGVTLAAQGGVVSPGETRLPLAIYVFLGTLLWQTFAEALDVAHQAFEGARSYLTRVYFSREAILLAQLYEAMLNAAIRFVIAMSLVAVMVGVEPLQMLLVGVAFGGAVVVGLGIGALLMPFTQLFADLHHTVKVVVQYGIFLTPAMYRVDGDGAFATIVKWNPITPLMEGARQAAAGDALEHPVVFALVLAAGVVASVVGFVFVRAVAPIVVERMLLGGR